MYPLDLKESVHKQSKIVIMEVKVYMKLFSLIDENLITELKRDHDFEWVDSQRRPDYLRPLIIDTVNRGAGAHPRH